MQRSLLLVLLAGCAAANRTNVIFMLVDELGWNNVPWHQGSVAQMPNTAALYSQGVGLSQHYVQRWCTPTRAALMTGRYIHRLGWTQFGSKFAEELSAVPSSFQMLPAVLGRANVSSHMLGKWHLGHFSQAHTPVGRGFGSYYGFLLGSETHDSHNSWGKHTCNLPVTDLYNGTRPARDSPDYRNMTYSSEMYGREAARIIDSHGQAVESGADDRGLFLYLAFQDCHAPYAPPDLYKRPFGKLKAMRLYFNAMMHAVDRAVGLVVQAMARHPSVYKDQSVIVPGSPGCVRVTFGRSSLATTEALPRWRITILFVGSFRTNAFLWAPGLLPMPARLPADAVRSKQLGRPAEFGSVPVYDYLMHVSDWYPTFAEIMGVDTQNTGPDLMGLSKPDGVSHWKAIKAKLQGQHLASPRTEIVHDVDPYKKVWALRMGRYKVIWGNVGTDEWIKDEDWPCPEANCCSFRRPPLPSRPLPNECDAVADNPPIASVTVKPGTGVGCATAASPCLFDVIADPLERVNLAANLTIPNGTLTPAISELLSTMINRVWYHQNRSFPFDIDHTNYTASDYCAIVQRDKWVMPFGYKSPTAGPEAAQIVTPSSPEYDQARQEHNRAIDAYPAAIAYARSTGGVQQALALARSSNATVTIRSGGHSLEGYSVCNGCVVIDTSPLNTVHANAYAASNRGAQVNVSGRTAWVGAGTKMGVLQSELMQYQLYGVAGTSDTVGISGYTLGGGWGLTSRLVGLSVDQVQAIEVVLANGTVVITNRTHEPLLFWAMRGAGGGNFGVATRFRLTVHQNPAQGVIYSEMRWPASQLSLLANIAQMLGPSGELADRVGLILYVIKANSTVQLAATVLVMDNDRELLGPLLRLKPIKSTVTVTQLHRVNSLIAAFESSYMPDVPLFEKKKSGFLNPRLRPEQYSTLLSALISGVANSPSGVSSAYLEAWGGRINRVSQSSTSFVHREFVLDLSICAFWQQRNQANENTKWLQNLYSGIKPGLSGSVYQNYVDSELTNFAVAYYGNSSTLEKLEAAKHAYDPNRLFSFPQGIAHFPSLGTRVASTPNNLRAGLIPASGAWRGAELGDQFGPDSDGKLAVYGQHYGRTPLHVYRIFNQTVGPKIKSWVADGGILWYNIKAGKQMSWKEAAEGKFDAQAKLWASQVRSLAPAKAFVALYHEPDHNVCFSTCRGGGVPGNTPANYRRMWQRIRAIFDQEAVRNAVWVMDYSVQISNNASDWNSECSEESCSPAAAVAPLWPGDDHVDWVFFNVFEKGKNGGKVKATFNEMVTASYGLLQGITTAAEHCNCVPKRDRNCSGCDLSSKPWGLGAFGAHGFEVTPPTKHDKPVTPDAHAQFLQDAANGFTKFPKLLAWLYYDSKECEVALAANKSLAAVQRAFQEYLDSKSFAINDAGAPPLQD